MGTTASTVRAAVDEARSRGVRIGSLRLRMFRPFPEAVLRRHLAGCRRVGVIDRDLCPGLGGIVWSEVRSTTPRGAIVQGYMMGVGGGDVRPAHVTGVVRDLLAREQGGAPEIVEVGQ